MEILLICLLTQDLIFVTMLDVSVDIVCIVEATSMTFLLLKAVSWFSSPNLELYQNHTLNHTQQEAILAWRW